MWRYQIVECVPATPRFLSSPLPSYRAPCLVAAMLGPAIALLIITQSVPQAASEKSRQGTGAPAYLARMALTTGGGCLGLGGTPTFLPFGSSVTVSSSTSVTLCFVQGGTLRTSIAYASGSITTVGAPYSLANDGAGQCFRLEPSYGVNGVTKRLENGFYNRIGPTGSAANAAGWAPGVCTTGGTATGVTHGRPCFVNADCTGGQTCFVSTTSRALIRGAFLCGRGSAAASVMVDVDF